MKILNSFREVVEDEVSTSPIPRLSRYREILVSYLNLCISSTLEGMSYLSFCSTVMAAVCVQSISDLTFNFPTSIHNHPHIYIAGDQFWDSLLKSVNGKFKRMDLSLEDGIHRTMDVCTMFRRLQSLCGFIINSEALADVRSLHKRQMEFLEKPMWYREKNAFPSANFTFSDIEEIIPNVKVMDVVMHAEAQALSLEAMNKHGKEADRLFAASLNLLKKAFASSPEMSDDSSFNLSHLVTVSKLMLMWGDHLFERAKTTRPTARSTRTSDWDLDTLASAGQMYQRSFLRTSNEVNLTAQGINYIKLRNIVASSSLSGIRTIGRSVLLLYKRYHIH